MRKRMTRLAAALAAVGLAVLAVCTQPGRGAADPDAGLPQAVKEGLIQFRNGSGAGLRAWVKDGPLDGTKVVEPLERMLGKVEAIYGRFESYDVIRVEKLTPRTQVIYLTLNYGKGPAFAKLVAYHARTGWVVPQLVANTDPSVVLPAQWREP